MENTLIVVSLIVIAALAKAVMDLSADGSLKFTPITYWLKALSWGRKWKSTKDEPLVEAFPGSSTFFVFLTDGWHLAQFVFLNSLFLALVLYRPTLGWFWDFLILRVVFGVTFEVSYSKLFRRS